jgi:hypothetical protein
MDRRSFPWHSERLLEFEAAVEGGRALDTAVNRITWGLLKVPPKSAVVISVGRV